MTIQYIDNEEKLYALCHQISLVSWIAIDTEFLREKTYYPKFCLLQVATPDWVACVDPLQLDDLSPLFEQLYRPDLTKVLHSCRQDFEIFFQITGKVPQPVFDTQIAAPLLGFQENPGYAMLVSSFLNVNLNKAHTRTDWSERPLSEAQIKYAADDVIYLCQIYQIMCEKLDDLGRLQWLEDDFKALENPGLYQLEPKNAWLRIKGKNKLTGRQLSIIQALSLWREETAQDMDKPRNWLIRDEMLLELAKLQPTHLGELAKVRNINSSFVGRHGKKTCALIAQAREQSPIPLHDDKRPPKKSQQQEAVLDVMTAVVRIRAEENALNPVILATRKDLEKLLFGEENVLLKGWRYSMVGKEILDLLEGRRHLALSFDDVAVIPGRGSGGDVNSIP